MVQPNKCEDNFAVPLSRSSSKVVYHCGVRIRHVQFTLDNYPEIYIQVFADSGKSYASLLTTDVSRANKQ